MAVSEQKVTVAVCDGCDRRQYGENGAKIPGMSGTVQVVDERGIGELNVQWFSCRPDSGHVGKAVTAAVQRRVQELELPPVPAHQG